MFTKVAEKLHTKVSTVMHRLEGSSATIPARRLLCSVDEVDLHLHLQACHSVVRQKGEQVLVEELRSPELADQTREGAKGLIEAVQQIRTAFKTITKTLRGLVSEKFIVPGTNSGQWVDSWLRFERVCTKLIHNKLLK